MCAASGRQLADGERCVAAIIENRDDGKLTRIDFAIEQWEAGARPAQGSLVGFWRTQVGAHDKPQTHLLDEESMLELLQQIEPGEPKRDALRLVLTLMLLRQRALIQDGYRQGRLLLRPRGVPKPPEGPPHIEVADTGLDEATIHEVMTELEPLVQPGGPPAGPPAGTRAVADASAAVPAGPRSPA